MCFCCCCEIDGSDKNDESDWLSLRNRTERSLCLIVNVGIIACYGCCSGISVPACTVCYSVTASFDYHAAQICSVLVCVEDIVRSDP